jgi:4-amino-4-deoxy-L-arabinose transferase-like glycosyltransferase
MIGSRHARAIVVGLILLAAVIRAWDIDHMSIWQDEGLSLYRASLDLPGILGGEIPLDGLVTPDVHPPLYFLLLAGWFRLVEDSTWAGKWFSLLAGLPVIPLLWALGRRWAGHRVGLVAAALGALSPAYLWYSQEIRSYTLLVTLGLLGVYALTRALGLGEEDGGRGIDPEQPTPLARARREGVAWLTLCLAANALLVWTHYLGFCLVAFEVLVVLVVVARRRSWRAALPVIALALLGLLALPLAPYALWRLGLGPERDQRFVSLTVMLGDVVRGFSFGKSADQGSLGVIALDVFFACLLIGGIIWLWRTRRSAALFLGGYLLVPVLALFALTTVKPVYLGMQHILLVSPAYYLLLAAGIVGAGDGWAVLGWGRRVGGGGEKRPQGAVGDGQPGTSDGWSVGAGQPRGAAPTRAMASWIAVVGLAVVAFGAMLVADVNFYTETAFQKDDLRGLAAYVDARAVPGDVLLVSDPVLKLAFDHLVKRLPVQSMPPMQLGGIVDPRPPGEQLAPVLAQHRRIWFMTPYDEMAQWLEAQALPVDSRGFEGRSIPVRIEAYERAPAPLLTEGPPRRETIHLGGLDLLGWDTLPDPLVAGEGGRVRLIWQVAERGLPDYKVALSLIDPDGRNYAQGDHEPYHGLNPTSRWPFGELAYEPHDLLVDPATPPGSYRLGITVYDPATSETFPPDGPATRDELSVVRPAEPIAPRSIDIPHRIEASGAGLTVLGYTLPKPEDGRWTAGARLPLAAWLRVDDPARLPVALEAELLGRFGQVVASASAPLGTAEDPASAWQAGDLRQVPLPIDLPADGGRYGLRLRLVESGGGTAWLRRGTPAILPVRGLWLDQVVVDAPARDTEVPPMAHRLDLAVGDGAQLLGYDLAMDALRPSGTLSTTLYWRGIAAMPASYRATVQLVPVDPATGDPTGPPVAQHDGIPAAGTRPTTGWAPGEVITDPHAFPLPADLAPGDYLVIAALYDPEQPDQPRPAVTQSGVLRDYVRLERIRVPAR